MMVNVAEPNLVTRLRANVSDGVTLLDTYDDGRAVHMRETRRHQAFSVVAAVVRIMVLGQLVTQIQGTLVLRSQTVVPTEPSAGAEFYLRRGEQFASAHQYDRAIADYTQAIQLKPDYAEAYNDRGFAFYLIGKGNAIADYTRAIELRPAYPRAYNNRGVAYMAGGFGRAKAVADFDRAIELQPDFRYAYINRANARLMRHPFLALNDFHRAGAYPEKTASRVVGAMLLLAVVIVAAVKRARSGRKGSV